MNKKDFAAVAVIVIAAMVIGLWAVGAGLDRARENQNTIMQQAMSNVGELPVDAKDAPPLEEDPAESEPQEDIASTPGEGENGSSSDETVVPEGDPLADALAAGDFSSAEVLIALGLLDPEKRPGMGSGEITLESLSQWMQTESMDALSAKAALQGAQAIAAGMGSEDDSQLRAFAKSQGSSNYQADSHRLEEMALELGLEYLRLRDVLTVREEILAFWLALEQSMQTLLAAEEEALEQQEEEPLPAQSDESADEEAENDSGETTEDGSEEDEEESDETILRYSDLVKEDLAALAEVIEQARADVEQSRSDLDAAARAILLATGRSADETLNFSGELVIGVLPTTSVEEAVERALANRNELKEAAFAIIRTEEQLKALRYQYAPGSPEILAQQTVLSKAQADYLTLLDVIELEIRDRYDALVTLYEELTQAAPETQEPSGETDGEETADDTGTEAEPSDDAADAAQEKSEIVEASAGSYQLRLSEDGQWVSNYAQLLEQWAQYGDEQIGRIGKTAEFAFALVCFEHATGVGTVFVPIA